MTGSGRSVPSQSPDRKPSTTLSPSPNTRLVDSSLPGAQSGPLASGQLTSERVVLNGEAIRQLQRTVGNRAIQRILLERSATPVVEDPPTSAKAGENAKAPIRRHPEGSALPDAADQATELGKNAPVEGSADGAGDGAAAVSTPVNAANPDNTEQAASPDGPAPSQEPPKGDSGTAPAPSGTKALSLAQAQGILTTTYGSVKTIVPGSIQLLDSTDAMWAKYDEVCIAGPVKNKSTGQTWKAGDAKARFPGGLNGFAWTGTVYVNKASALETTTPHEMLHLNTAPKFRAAVGETFNEGATQFLTLKALKEGGITLKTYPYQEEVDLTSKLVDLVGESTLTQAYFNGPDTLIQAYETLKGTGKFADLKGLAEKRDFAGAAALLTPAALPKPPPPDPEQTGDFPTPDPNATTAVA